LAGNGGGSGKDGGGAAVCGASLVSAGLDTVEATFGVVSTVSVGGCGGTGGAGWGLSPGSGRVTTGGGDCLAQCNWSLERPGLPSYQHRLESTIRHDHHLPSWPGDDWHSVALAAELISSSATAINELALVTRASLAAWSARRAPSSRIGLSAARPLRLVPFFGAVPACMADILHRQRRSRPSMVAVSTMCSGWNTISMMSFV
jgi:hypothetical protein